MLSKVLLFIFLLICFLFMAQPSLQFSPLKVALKAPFQAAGWILIFLGVACVSYNERKQAQADEHVKINKIIKQAIEEKRKEEGNAEAIK